MTGCSLTKHILSLFDFSGVWSQPYADAGYRVERVDIQTGVDVLDLDPAAYEARYGPVHGILAAPPCTHFAVSGARWWAEKDKDGRTQESLELIDAVIEIIHTLRPAWWALENPVGRLTRLRPQLGEPWFFQPWWFGDPYSKKTGLWGNFNRDLPRNNVKPIMHKNKGGKQGSWQWAKLGGNHPRISRALRERSGALRLRSQTPGGFAQAFFTANP